MRILVTGGAGYLGSVIVEELLKHKHEVTVLDNLKFNQLSLLSYTSNKRFKFVYGDVTDKKLLKRLCDGVDVVIPLAAVVGFPACSKDPELAEKLNYQQIVDVAESVSEIVPNSYVEFAEGAEPDKRSYRVDFSKIKSSLPSFHPIWTVRKGADELYKAYIDYGMKMELLEGPMFRRVKHLQKLLEKGQVDSSLKWKK